MAMRLLMLVRDPSWFGGVVNFVKSLEVNLSDNVDVTEFRIGRRKGARGKWFQPLVPLFDAARLAWQRLCARFSAACRCRERVRPNVASIVRCLARDALFASSAA